MIQRSFILGPLAMSVGCLLLSAPLPAANKSPISQFATQHIDPFRIGNVFNLADLLNNQQAHNDSCDAAYKARTGSETRSCTVASFAKYRLPAEQYFYPPIKLLIQGYAQAGKVLDPSAKSGTFAKLAQSKLSEEDQVALNELQSKVAETSAAIEEHLKNKLYIRTIQPKSLFLVKLATSIEKCEADLASALNKLLSTPLYTAFQSCQADVLSGKIDPIKGDISTLLTPYQELLRGNLSWLSAGLLSSKPATVKDLLKKGITLAHEALKSAAAVNDRAIASVKADAGIPTSSIVTLWQNRIADASEIFLGSGVVIICARLLAADIANKADALTGTIAQANGSVTAIDKEYKAFEKIITPDNQFLNACLQTVAECASTTEITQLTTSFDALYRAYQEARGATYDHAEMLLSRFPSTPLVAGVEVDV